MKKNYSLIVFIFCFTFMGTAQNFVTVDASANLFGYANVFELDGETFAFGEGWGVPDLKTVVDQDQNTLTLQPNFNTWGDGTDPFWVDQDTGLGNKIFEGNTYVEDNTLVGSELTFVGNVTSVTIDPAYTVVAFIKVFNSDYSFLKTESTVITTTGSFSLLYDNIEDSDAVVQYGFYVSGVNANPDNEEALGSVQVTAGELGVNDINTINVSLYPNPTDNNINIKSDEQISEVLIYNTLGQTVKNIFPDAFNFSLDTSTLNEGVYFAVLSTEKGSKTIKFIKK